MTITVKIIRKITGNSTVTYDGATRTEIAPRTGTQGKTRQRTPRPTPEPAPRAQVETDVIDIHQIVSEVSAQWARDHVMIVGTPEPTPSAQDEINAALTVAREIETITSTPKEQITIHVKALLAILKPLPKTQKSFIEVRGNTYPVKTLFDLARLADSDMLTITIEADHTFAWWDYGERYKDPVTLKEKQTPALIIRHGNTKSTLIPSRAPAGASIWTWAI